MDGLGPLTDLLAWCLDAVHSSPGYEIATWFLALVFLWSGAVKVARPKLAAVAIADFRLVRRPRRWHGLALGAFELAVAAALVAGSAMHVVLGVTTAMLAVFAALILRSLLAGERFACFCFGGQDDGLSWTSFARTLALGGLAALLAVAPLGTATRGVLSEETYLALITAGGALLTLVALSRVPRLLRWNREVTAFYNARAEEVAA